MKTKGNDSKIVFKTVEEYQNYYNMKPKNEKIKSSKYYQIGFGIAKLVCENLINKKNN